MEQAEKKRWVFPDLLRGVTLLSMICYHAAYDIVCIAGYPWKWFGTRGSYIWQQSICWTFILLSGFSFALSGRKAKKGLLVFGGGILLSLITLLIIPKERIICGVLTLLGSCMLLMLVLEKALGKIAPGVGAAGAFLLFLLCRNINTGYLGFASFQLLKLPERLYRGGYGMAYLGFPGEGFASSDYFSLLPWSFLYLTGYYLFGVLKRSAFLNKTEEIWETISSGVKKCLGIFLFLGRHSFLVYLLHQPILYGLLLLYLHLSAK